VFANKPATLDDIKQNVAQYIHLSSIYHLRVWEMLDKTKVGVRTKVCVSIVEGNTH